MNWIITTIHRGWVTKVKGRWWAKSIKFTWLPAPSRRSSPLVRMPSWARRRPSWCLEYISLDFPSTRTRCRGSKWCLKMGGRNRLALIDIKQETNLPFLMLASVYSKPGAWPVLRPIRPHKLGPVLWPPFCSTVWHWAHRCTKTFFPFSALPPIAFFCLNSKRGRVTSKKMNWLCEEDGKKWNQNETSSVHLRFSFRELHTGRFKRLVDEVCSYGWRNDLQPGIKGRVCANDDDDD